jgi:hypothetical protein
MPFGQSCAEMAEGRIPTDDHFWTSPSNTFLTLTIAVRRHFEVRYLASA